MTNEIYALINNGAYGQAGALEDISRDSFRKAISIECFWMA